MIADLETLDVMSSMNRSFFLVEPTELMLQTFFVLIKINVTSYFIHFCFVFCYVIFSFILHCLSISVFSPIFFLI